MNIGTWLLTFFRGRLVGTDSGGNRYFIERSPRAHGAKLRRWEERLTDLEDGIAGQTEVQGLAGVEMMFATWQAEAELDRELAALKAEKTQPT